MAASGFFNVIFLLSNVSFEILLFFRKYLLHKTKLCNKINLNFAACFFNKESYLFKMYNRKLIKINNFNLFSYEELKKD